MVKYNIVVVNHPTVKVYRFLSIGRVLIHSRCLYTMKGTSCNSRDSICSRPRWCTRRRASGSWVRGRLRHCCLVVTVKAGSSKFLLGEIKYTFTVNFEGTEVFMKKPKGLISRLTNPPESNRETSRSKFVFGGSVLLRVRTFFGVYSALHQLCSAMMPTVVGRKRSAIWSINIYEAVVQVRTSSLFSIEYSPSMV